MNALTKAERITLLTEWLLEYKKVESTCNSIEMLFGKNSDGDVQARFWQLFESYTKLVAIQVGDDYAWLNWFIWENDCGKNAMEAKAASWKKARKIRTVKDLEAIISAK
jgi:hypothetical protein